jgi:hypothetical protein
LHIEIATPNVGDYGGCYKEEDLPPVILVADSYEVDIIDGGGEDETGRRRKGPQSALWILIGIHGMAS